MQSVSVEQVEPTTFVPYELQAIMNEDLLKMFLKILN